jgi:hypothetical protein
MLASVPFVAPIKSLFSAADRAIAPARPQPQIETTTMAEANHGPAIAPIRAAYVPARTPIPPRRPLDLGTIPGAGEPIGAPRLPASAALSFAPTPPTPDPAWSR